MAKSSIARLGTGISVAFQGVTFELYKADPPAPKREFADVTHMLSTNYREFIPHDLFDPGQGTLDAAFDPSTDVGGGVLSGAAIMTIYFPTRTAADGSTQAAKNWSFSAALVDYKPTAAMEEKMTASLTVKCLGAITVT